jgi:hypothetical protein
MVAYRFEDSRSSECLRRHLNGYRGILQVDGYAAYNEQNHLLYAGNQWLRSCSGRTGYDETEVYA